MPDVLHLPRARSVSAIYLIGHGPYREPRLIDLQYLRILRYRRALSEKRGREFEGGETFIDMNFARTYLPDQDDLPNLSRLLEQVRAGVYQVVFLDLAESEDFHPRRYLFVREWLERAGAEVINAFYDDALIGEILAEHYGSVPLHLLPQGGADDFLALFPALAGRIGREALRELFDDMSYSERDRYEAVERVFHYLGQENPYQQGRIPTLSSRARHRLGQFAYEREEAERARRRETETLYCCGPDDRGELLDSYLSVLHGAPRDPDGLGWAEARVVGLGFEKTVDGQRVTYLCNVEGQRVYADLRRQGSIAFHVYPPADASPPRR